MGHAIDFDQRNSVAWITLNRPERLNAMNSTLIEELLDALERAAEADDIRAVVLTGAGRGFCVGGDLNDVVESNTAKSAEQRIANLRRQARSSELLHGMNKITVAAVNGACAGAGFSLACAADLRIASASAVFKTSFLSAGVSGDFGGAWLLSHIVGPAKARELFILNQALDAESAAAIGLVNEVVADDELIERVTRIATQLTDAAPLALPRMKGNLNDALSMSLPQALDSETARHVWTLSTEDAAEAASAFIEKREPVFRGV